MRSAGPWQERVPGGGVRRLADALRCLDGGRSIMRVTAMLICLVVLGAGSRWDSARGDGTKYRTLAESSKDAGHRTIVQEIKVVYRSAPTYSNVLSSGNAYVYSDALFKGGCAPPQAAWHPTGLGPHPNAFVLPPPVCLARYKRPSDFCFAAKQLRTGVEREPRAVTGFCRKAGMPTAGGCQSVSAKV